MRTVGPLDDSYFNYKFNNSLRTQAYQLRNNDITVEIRYGGALAPKTTRGVSIFRYYLRPPVFTSLLYTVSQEDVEGSSGAPSCRHSVLHKASDTS